MSDNDAGYRRLFSDKRMVADLIRGYVPQSWVADLDLDTLEMLSGSFVAEEYRRRESDVIWRVRFRDQWLYVYLLIEFQSTVDRFMALRMMVYVGLLYQRLQKEG
ncbi:MAG: transposase, partial [Planctomycetota bacterium]